MKNYRRVLSVSVAVLSLSCTVSMAALPPVYVVDQFNSSSSADAWFDWYSNVPLTFSYDDTLDAGGGGAGSGSLKVSADFSDSYPGGQFFLGRCLSGNPWDMSVSVPATAYAYLSYDIRWDSGSTLDGDGTFGTMFVQFVDPTYQYLYPESMVSAPSGATDWVHVQVPISHADAAFEVSGFWFRMWEGQTSGQFSINGPVTFWLDNVELTNVPEPSSFVLLAGGGLLLVLHRRRRVGE